MADSLSPTPEMIQAMTRSRCVAKRAQLREAVGRKTPRLVGLLEIVVASAAIASFVAAAPSGWPWPPFVAAVAILVFYQWRIGRLEARLDAVADCLETEWRSEDQVD